MKIALTAGAVAGFAAPLAAYLTVKLIPNVGGPLDYLVTAVVAVFVLLTTERVRKYWAETK